MSQAENDSEDDSDCEYFLTPNAHQYNITEKIKEANSVLFSNETELRRKHSPKVKFRDHKLVDFEDDESMDIQMQSNAVEEEVSDDGYSEEIVNESYEIEDVSEQIQQLETEVEEEKEKEVVEEETYEKETFCEEIEEIPVENCEKPDESPEKLQPKATVFRPKSAKVEPTDELSRAERRKTCCAFKHSDEYKEKLPKYNGYSSNYVSKEVFTKRELVRYKKMQSKQEKFEQQLEQKKLSSETNEEAFAQWLNKKMRNPVNKSNPINYFDFKAPNKKRSKRRQTVDSDEEEKEM